MLRENTSEDCWFLTNYLPMLEEFITVQQEDEGGCRYTTEMLQAGKWQDKLGMCEYSSPCSTDLTATCYKCSCTSCTSCREFIHLR